MSDKLIDNTPEEITDVVMEMDSRINGTWVVNDEEEDLQNKFWSLFKHKFLKSPTFRIGSNFLKKNPLCSLNSTGSLNSTFGVSEVRSLNSTGRLM